MPLELLTAEEEGMRHEDMQHLKIIATWTPCAILSCGYASCDGDCSDASDGDV